MFRRILLFLGLLLIAFFAYRRYDEQAADTLLYTVKTLSPSEEDSNKGSGYSTAFISNEYDTGSKKDSPNNSKTEGTTSSGSPLQEVIDLSKELSLGILSLTIAGLQSSTGQELISTAEQEFNAIVEQALNATLEQDNNTTTGGNTATTGSSTTTTVATNPSTTTKTTTTTTPSTTKSSLSAQDKEEAEAFLELFH